MVYVMKGLVISKVKEGIIFKDNGTKLEAFKMQKEEDLKLSPGEHQN